MQSFQVLTNQAAMFTIYQTNIGGRVSRRYFRTWAAAKIAIDEEIQEYKKLNWAIIERSNRMNGDKGFYEYGVRGRTSEGEEFSAALIEAYFEDKPNE